MCCKLFLAQTMSQERAPGKKQASDSLQAADSDAQDAETALPAEGNEQSGEAATTDKEAAPHTDDAATTDRPEEKTDQADPLDEQNDGSKDKAE